MSSLAKKRDMHCKITNVRLQAHNTCPLDPSALAASALKYNFDRSRFFWQNADFAAGLNEGPVRLISTGALARADLLVHKLPVG